MKLSDDRVEKAMAYLAETDLQFAHWKGQMLRSEYLAEVAEAMVYKAIEGGSVEDRKRAAKVAPETKQAMEDHFQAVVQYETLKARRAREVLVVDLWRTLSANRRQGPMT